MSFKPVELVSPDGGSYTATSPVDLNDRITEGYTRSEKRASTPSPSPSRFAAGGSVSSSSESASSSDAS